MSYHTYTSFKTKCLIYTLIAPSLDSHHSHFMSVHLMDKHALAYAGPSDLVICLHEYARYAHIYCEEVMMTLTRTLLSPFISSFVHNDTSIIATVIFRYKCQDRGPAQFLNRGCRVRLSRLLLLQTEYFRQDELELQLTHRPNSVSTLNAFQQLMLIFIDISNWKKQLIIQCTAIFCMISILCYLLS